MPRLRHPLLSALLALAAAGCFMPRSQYIDVQVVNNGERAYDDVVITCDQCDGAMLVNGRAGGVYTHVMAMTKMPRRVEVSFEEEGRARRVTLAVPDTRELQSNRRLLIAFRDGQDPTLSVSGVTRGGRTMSLPRRDPGAVSPGERLFQELEQAVLRRDSAGVARLLEGGAPVAHAGFSVLHLAVERGGLGVLSALLARPLDVPRRHVLEAIHAAAQDDDVATLRLLRARGAWPATPDSLHDALQSSVMHGSGASLRWFVEEAGVPVNTPLTEMGHTMLDIAVQGTAVQVPARRAQAETLAAYLRSKGGVQAVTPRR